MVATVITTGPLAAAFWSYGFMQRALIAALLIGLVAPSVGIYLVQRRLALIGDGLGHVALAGVAVGLVTSASPVWTALAVAVFGAVIVEWIRTTGRAGGDSALAIMFYGGIATGLVVVSQAPDGTPANLNAYLFGAITTTSWSDVAIFLALSVVVLTVTVGLRRWLFAASNDDEFARASGLPVLRLNLLVAVLTAVTVVVSMRVVGLLLVSALMVVPVAAAQQFTRSFAHTMAAAIAIGVASALGGVVTSRYASTPSGPTIILVAIGIFVLAALSRSLVARGSWHSSPADPDGGPTR
ncbi:MAG: metal ABC transporter permease [Actinobacteria bacterium]|nr:metal ABC transporter permease [Actinomycetota bacterium]